MRTQAVQEMFIQIRDLWGMGVGKVHGSCGISVILGSEGQ